MLKQGEKIGLQDRRNVDIKVGDKLEALAGIGTRISKGDELLCIWNVPNHRFGFVFANYIDGEEEYESSCPAYATPKNAKKLKVIS